ncbi:hypothetical protein C7999DRAFT_42981 [Corynascus novoguineensis]|uniref:Uncharacterized protein n=1 Tax=Corynascus novoguineensis TaxID=1126955 RepID=A0AAN7HMX3_9PEZI|nr:hypothetical protein C7999DRAFT_42981 [Corynascus novoguineensis]
MGRPTGITGRTQLKQDDLIRIQTLSRDARMGPSEIRRVTGYSIHQIKYALKKKTPTVGKRSGRPRKGEAPAKKKSSVFGDPGSGPEIGNGQSAPSFVNQGDSVGTGEGGAEVNIEMNNQLVSQVSLPRIARLTASLHRGQHVRQQQSQEQDKPLEQPQQPQQLPHKQQPDQHHQPPQPISPEPHLTESQGGPE